MSLCGVHDPGTGNGRADVEWGCREDEKGKLIEENPFLSCQVVSFLICLIFAKETVELYRICIKEINALCSLLVLLSS